LARLRADQGLRDHPADRIVTSFFTSVYVTRLMTSVWLRRSRPKLLPL